MFRTMDMPQVYDAGDDSLQTSMVEVLKVQGEGGRLVDLGRALVIDDVHQSPWIGHQIELQLALLIDRQLGFGLEESRALALVSIIEFDLAGGQIERARLPIVISLTEP